MRQHWFLKRINRGEYFSWSNEFGFSFLDASSQRMVISHNLRRVFLMHAREMLMFSYCGNRSGYRTPLRGLYLCGSGTHPGGGVMGAPGRNAARVVMQDLNQYYAWGLLGLLNVIGNIWLKNSRKISKNQRWQTGNPVLLGWRLWDKCGGPKPRPPKWTLTKMPPNSNSLDYFLLAKCPFNIISYDFWKQWKYFQMVLP